MTLLDVINKLLGRQPASANTAKQRLQLVQKEHGNQCFLYSLH